MKKQTSSGGSPYDFSQQITDILAEAKKVNEQQLQWISPVVEDMVFRRTEEVDEMLTLLYDLMDMMVITGVGEATFYRLCAYLETVDRHAAEEARDQLNDLMGYYDYAIDEAFLLAEQARQLAWKKSRSHKIEDPFPDDMDMRAWRWKVKVVGYLHFATIQCLMPMAQIIQHFLSHCRSRLLHPHPEDRENRSIPVEEMDEIADALSVLQRRKPSMGEWRQHVLAAQYKCNEISHRLRRFRSLPLVEQTKVQTSQDKYDFEVLYPKLQNILLE